MENSELEKNIITLLKENARLSASEIAGRLNVPTESVEKIIASLESEKIICGYTAIVNAPLEDHSVKALIEVKVTPRREGGFDQVARRIAKYPEVTELCLVSGNCDLLLTVQGETLQEVAHFVASKLATIDGVVSTSTAFMLRKYKESGVILEDDEDYERLKVCF